jgi:diaminopimelate decarboxylase
VYSRRTLVEHYQKLAAAFRELSPLICYSLKSCGNIHIARVLVEEGSGLDVVSGGELERAWLAGCPMERVVYAGVGKSDREIMAALDGRYSLLLAEGERPRDQETERRSGEGGGLPLSPEAAQRLRERGPIGYFNIESEPEFENVAAIARRVGVRARGALRVNPDVDPKTHVYTSTGKKETKFGVDIERAMAFFERYGRDEWLKLDAIHLHIGSPVYEIGPYASALEKSLALIDDLGRCGVEIRALDLGGGFGADYETDKSPLAADYAQVIVPLLRERVERGLKVIIEPGRTISANSGVLLTRVLYVKQGGGGKQFVICDAGMNTLLRPALYSAFHFIWPAEPGTELVPPKRAEQVELPGLVKCDVVGPLCESGDFLGKERLLPPVKRGDVVAVFTAGAYGMSMANNYNSQPLPAEVLVSGNEARVVRRRQTVAEVLGWEV